MTVRKPKFDFKTACEAMLLRLGATTGTYHDLMIPTVAGPLQCTPYADWLACAFDDVQAARAKVGHGSLNPFSGKWNWMYDRPGPNELAHLHEQLARVVVPRGEVAAMLDGYARSLQALDGLGDIGTRLTYMYRDADNFKACGESVFAGVFRYPEDLAPLLLALDFSNGAPSFIPGQVGLTDLQDSFEGCLSRWDPSRDHPWHEVTGIEAVRAAHGELTDDRNTSQFAYNVIHACAQGWDEKYRPPFYPVMKARHDRYVAEQAERAPAARERAVG